MQTLSTTATPPHFLISNGMRVFVLLVLATALTIPAGIVSAEISSADVNARRAELQAQLDQLDKEIGEQNGNLTEKRKERQSLERDISILDAQIQKAKLSVRARDLTIETIVDDIGEKANTIVALDDKLVRERQSLAELFRKTHELDNYTVAEFLLSAQTVSEFFQDIDAFTAIKAALQDSFIEIAGTKVTTTEAKTTLEQKKIEQEQLRQLQVLEQKKIENQQKERQSILKVTKGEETAYQLIIQAKQKTAAQIRSELFTLRDSAAIPFGTALDLANYASSKTGVRPALILAVMKQETDLGQNLGTGTYIKDMHPTRDVPVFLKIAEVLGYTAVTMPVSKQPGYGWGGAMGPGQFIPSTWACYGGFINVTTGKCGKGTDGTYAGPWAYSESADVLRKLSGKASPSDPWDNRDSFLATGFLMKDNGAAAGTAAAERLAALRYFAGWGNANKSAYAFYGDGVMEYAAFFEQQIAILGGG